MALLSVSRIVKQEGVYKLLQEGDSEKCLKICELLSLIVCYFKILVEKSSMKVMMAQACQNMSFKSVVVFIWVISLFITKLVSYLDSRQHYVTTIAWSPENKVLITWVNRDQDLSIVNRCQTNGVCVEVRTIFKRIHFTE